MRTSSPFPGMDPWLEASWGNVHLRLISELQSQIAGQLPDDLFAAVEETVYVFNQDQDDQLLKRTYRPDVGLFNQPGTIGGAARVAVMEPDNDFVRIVFPVERS